ncbi:hypothetical protein [Streptomyces lycii]|uniref:Uncharacterized protein n=1 Tax=Streptomyces lycii TaxID=2654337 RepID=A0ABQ7FNI9_9ACTN|nr:hypothetical protein [Streptomyces lycii]KAF4410260.1 hypothetical protein GCU69_04700 [Streptomyces lycii]
MQQRRMLPGLALVLAAVTLPAAPAAGHDHPHHGGHGTDRAAHEPAARPHGTPRNDPAHGDRERDLATARAATKKFRSEKAAIAAGYHRTEICASSPMGGMGYHYVNPAHIGSTDPAKPAAVLYEPGPDGTRRLVAIEYLVNDKDADLETDQDRPRMFGQDFQGPMPGHEPNMPVHYDLHVWLYKKNPKGLFAEWNPRVHCPEGSGTPH